MNVQTTIKAPPAWEKYLPAITAFKPGASEPERRHRAGLMLLRDMALAGQRRASWEAIQALQAIATIAGQHAFTDMPVEQLDATRRALVRLYTGARDLDATFMALQHDGR